MSQQAILRLIMNEDHPSNDGKQFLYTEVLQFLWNEGASVAVVYRPEEGIDDKNRFRSRVLEEIEWNDVPIVIDVVDNFKKLQTFFSPLRNMLTNGQILLIPSFDDEGGTAMSSEHLMLKIYLIDQESGFKKPLYEEVMEVMQSYELVWTVVVTGMHKQSIFSLSSQVPVMIESIGTAQVIQELLLRLQPMLKEGTMITLPVRVIRS